MMSPKAAPKKSFTRRSRRQDPDATDPAFPTDSTDNRPPSSSGNLFSAIGKHASEVDRRAADVEKKRKRDKYGDRQGKEVLKRYKYADDSELAQPFADEGKGKEAGAAEEEDIFGEVDEEALMQAMEVESPVPFSNPHPPARITTHNEPPYEDASTESFGKATRQDSRGSRGHERTAQQAQHKHSQAHQARKELPVTPIPSRQLQAGGRRAVPQYDNDTPSSPYTVASSSGPVTPRTPVSSTPSRPVQGREARLAAIKNATVAVPIHQESKTAKSQQPHRRRGGFVTQPRGQGMGGMVEEDEFADDAFDALLARTDMLDDGLQLGDFDGLY